jgi:aminopeptidase-like protein
MEGRELYDLAERLYPIPRSLTGEVVRRTFDVLGELIPLERTEVPSGTEIYDWRVPPEWNVRRATLRGPGGEVLADYAANPLHLVGYSEPVRATLRGSELRPRLHALADRPGAIPYRTSYYERTWGLCVTHELVDAIDDQAEYEVEIDSSLDEHGSLTYAETVVPGRAGGGEILVVTHVCHPNLANDGVAGIVVLAGLVRSLEPGTLRNDVRFLFAPTGVGVLSWLHRNEASVGRVIAGIVLSCAGDAGPLTYKRSRHGDAAVDRAAASVLAGRDGARIEPFVPWGGDERQFSSPGFDLPVGALSRTPHGLYPEYHTSADDLSLISPRDLEDSLAALREIVEVADANLTFTRTEPHGEPQLSRHGLSGAMTPSLLAGGEEERRALFWVLNLADGHHDLLAIAARAQIPFRTVRGVAEALEEAGLVRPAVDGTATERSPG